MNSSAKWCPNCKTIKSRNTDFYILKSTGRPMGICKICSKAQAAHYHMKRIRVRTEQESAWEPNDEILWRDVPGFPDYRVSENGNLRKIRTTEGSRARIMQCHIRNGYITVRFGRGKVHPVHVLVALAFIGPRPSALHEVAHWDGDKANNSYSNLRWATHAENCADTIRLGRTPRGEKAPHHKLKIQDVIDIRSGALGGTMQAARALGVHPATVSSAKHGKSWGWIDADARESYDEAVRAIGAKVKNGAPLPSFFLPGKNAAE